MLEYSGTHFDHLFASKIEAKLNNLEIDGDILVNFLRILSTNRPYLKKTKLEKLIFDPFQHIAHLSLCMDISEGWIGGKGRGGVCMSLTRTS